MVAKRAARRAPDAANPRIDGAELGLAPVAEAAAA